MLNHQLSLQPENVQQHKPNTNTHTHSLWGASPATIATSEPETSAYQPAALLNHLSSTADDNKLSAVLTTGPLSVWYFASPSPASEMGFPPLPWEEISWIPPAWNPKIDKLEYLRWLPLKTCPRRSRHVTAIYTNRWPTRSLILWPSWLSIREDLLQVQQ